MPSEPLFHNNNYLSTPELVLNEEPVEEFPVEEPEEEAPIDD